MTILSVCYVVRMWSSQATLAINIQTNPGVYALLLGSGISRAAGIPTGWDIVLDLIRRVAKAQSEDCADNPEQWYSRKFGESPDYSKLLLRLGATPSERQSILRQYFEPNEEEREAGKKLPTAAHGAIGDLVANGSLKVIITTNFDRLLEMALESRGVTPTVISTLDAIDGARPLVHNRCTIVKVHGDYLDTRIRNTPEELELYDPRLNALLDRILDEYGLVICGWSGDWDAALRSAIHRCPNHRFSTHWASISNLGDRALPLASLRRATLISIKSADDFFTTLADQVQALSEMAVPNQVSVAVGTSLVRRYVVDDAARIKLHDLVTRETERIYATFEAGRNGRFDVGQNVPTHFSYVMARVKVYAAEVETLRAMLTEGVAWGRSHQISLWVEPIRRLARHASQPESGNVFYINLRRYPAMRLMYSIGLAAMWARQYDVLAGLFRTPNPGTVNERSAPLPLPISVSQLELPIDQNERIAAYFAVSEHMFQSLREGLRNLIPDDDDYQELFDRFEFILALVGAVEKADLSRENYSYIFPRLARPRGFFVNTRSPLLDKLGIEVLQQDSNWPPLAAGVFGDKSALLREAITQVLTRFGPPSS